ncbi:hypothetical protein RRG08_040304 [Elysia crispata]|uniref:Uncharacterized protein n=1 Tax=Elysia crispata TaxID=231223 RepID=A0AAE1D9R8_9GAST|nr:hypothetical protein RRG08_040304 [Elysia crispata]
MLDRDKMKTHKPRDKNCNSNSEEQAARPKLIHHIGNPIGRGNRRVTGANTSTSRAEMCGTPVSTGLYSPGCPAEQIEFIIVARRTILLEMIVNYMALPGRFLPAYVQRGSGHSADWLWPAFLSMFYGAK